MAGSNTTYQGKPCKRGHSGLRWKSNNSCIECSREQQRQNPRQFHPLFKTWQGMIQRCENRNHPSYRDYGAKGVTVCERWRYSFQNFLNDMEPRPSPKHTIDRYPNTAGNYEPENCRWATRTEQNRNQRTHVILTLEKARTIRALYANGFSMSKIGGQFDVTKQSVYKIVHHKSWKE